jgi:pilus assembly protein Flp/PilA
VAGSPSRRDDASRAHRDAGASAVEYGLILVAVAAVIVMAVYALGGQVKGMFSDSTACLEQHTSSSC